MHHPRGSKFLFHLALPLMGNAALDTVLACGNTSDALKAREKELDDVRAQAEEYKEQAERYKRQLEEIMAKGNNGIMKNGSVDSNLDRSVSASSMRKGGTKVGFADEVPTPAPSLNANNKKNSANLSSTVKKTLNPSLFSYNPSGRI